MNFRGFLNQCTRYIFAMGDEEVKIQSYAAFSQPEPDTQQVNSQNSIEELIQENDDDSTWGNLYPTWNFKFEPVALRGDSYSFGRSARCDVIIKEEHVGDNLLISVISKNQFRIFKETLSSETQVTQLEDLSMNGTFVNKTKVGKGKRVLLSNGDEIALANPHSKVYIFVNNSANKNWIPMEMKQVYSVKSPLGKGAYGEVKLAQNTITGKLVAIKKIKKREGKEKKIFNEVKILQNLKHPCVVTMENVFDTSDSLFIVLEYIGGGELAMRINEVTKMPNGEAKSIFYQLVLALQYLHRKGVAHRDLKPENVLLSGRGNSAERLVKVSDFGLSKLVDSKTGLKSFCGTPLYTAPEILMTQGTGCYTHQVDIWSLGVILFQCMSGKLPFYKERSPLPVVEQIVRASYSMAGPEWRGVSPQAASLIRKMLNADPKQRITIDQILAHPWLQDEEMKNKVNRLMRDTSPCGDENLFLDFVRPNKRPRLDEDDTLHKS